MAAGVAAVLGVSLGPAGAVPAAAEPAAAQPAGPVGRSVPVSAVSARARTVARSEREQWVPPRVAWPAPGAAAVDVTQAAGLSRAGDLPVWVGRGAPAPGARRGSAQEQMPAGAPVRVRVELLDRTAALRAGVSGLLLRVSRVDGVAGSAPVAVEVDLSGFQHAYGGDWAARLTLRELPACAASTPEVAVCQRVEPVPSAVLDRSRDRLRAQVQVDGQPRLFAVGSTVTSVGGGDYSKTPLTAAYSWQAGLSSGDFAWSYPLRMPPAVGGPAPQVAMRYSAGAVDGRTYAEGAQASWAGEGWDYWPGFIERRYRPCKDDLDNSPIYTDATADLCWRLPNATMVWNGRSSELVPTATAGVWRLADDDGSRVQLLTGAVNGDDNGEHWLVTTGDGTQYYFGRSRLPGWVTGKPETKSAWVAPVFANHSGEPCQLAGGFAGSYCDQAWRWNLDYVVDPHGNTMSYWYLKETNKTGLAGVIGTTRWYDRGGVLDHIDYGTRSGAELTGDPPARVVLARGDRCLSSCWNGNQVIASNWPDSPWDLNCQQSPCGNNVSPSFWTTQRLAKVTTQVRGATGMRDVDEWTFTHSFPATGETNPTTDPSLWLASIGHTGKVNGTVTLPSILTGGTRYANRTDYNLAAGVPMANKYRLTSVTTGAGGELAIAYEGSDCTTTSQADPDTNAKRCFPQYFTPPGGSPGWSWWNKYRVTSVTEKDLVGGAPDVVHSYAYSMDGSSTSVLWHHNDDAFSAPLAYRSWSVWRGYSMVTVTDGTTAGSQSHASYLFFRGMHADRTDAGEGTRLASITDSQGAVVTDTNNLAGRLREKTMYDGPGGAALSGEVTDVWQQETASRTLPTAWASPSVFKAFYTRTAATKARTWLAHASAWRRTEVATTYDTTYGQPTLVEDKGDTAVATDDACTSTSYARNTTTWLVDYPAEQKVTNCAPSPSGSDYLSGSQTFYDGSTTVGAAPTRGLATRANALASVSGTTLTWAQQSRATYDAQGRVRDAFDALDRRTTTDYTPAAGGPLTAMTVTNPASHAVSVTLEPAWGTPLTTTDANSKVTTGTYDALGRLVGVWLPGRSTALTGNVEYAYAVRTTAVSSVTTRTLGPNGNQVLSYEMFDGLLRPRQTQAPAAQANGGRWVTDTAYDNRGLAVKRSELWNSGAATDTLVTFTDSSVVRQGTAVHDQLGRVTNQVTMSLGVEQWRTVNAYDGDRVSTTPPSGGTATTVTTDARGRRAALWQYQAATPTGPYDATGYGYDRLGRLTTVTDAVSNTWTWGHDLRGRRTQAQDPDKGTTTMTYDDAGQLLTSTDARGVVLAYGYDSLGRRTGLFLTSTGRQLSAAGLSTYVSDTTYHNWGQVYRRFLGTGTNRVRLTDNVEELTGRLLKNLAHTEHPARRTPGTTRGSRSTATPTPVPCAPWWSGRTAPRSPPSASATTTSSGSPRRGPTPPGTARRCRATCPTAARTRTGTPTSTTPPATAPARCSTPPAAAPTSPAPTPTPPRAGCARTRSRRSRPPAGRAGPTRTATTTPATRPAAAWPAPARR
ncbi:MAG TPA: hypothetical protein VFM55_23175 [Micromonosporaceae bacterium]|nr:hypothetical protein [Micromonosporaceae bacterium]